MSQGSQGPVENNKTLPRVWWSFRSKLVFIFLILSLLPLVIVGCFAIEYAKQSLNEITVRHLMVVSVLKEAEFTEWINDNKQKLRELAERAPVRDYVVILTTSLPNTAAYQTAFTTLRDDYLQHNLDYIDSSIDLFLLDSQNGRVIVSTNPQQIGEVHSHNAYFIDGKQETSVQTVFYAPALKQAAVVISTPIKNQLGELMAVLVSHLDPAEMSAIMLVNNNVNTTEETYLVNKYNFFVTDSRFESGFALKKDIHTEGVNNCLAGNSGTGHYENYRGQTVIGVYRWLPDWEMCILTEIEEAEALAPVFKFRMVVGNIAWVMSLGVIILALIFARTITQPIQQLINGVNELAQGNLDYRITGKTGDELAILAAAFNSMVIKRKQAIQAISESEARLALIFRSVPVAFCTISKTGELWFSSQFEALTGIPGAEFAADQQLWLTRMHPDDQVKARLKAKEFQEKGEYDCEFQWRCGDGAYRWFYSYSRQLYDDQGQPDQTIGIWIDITARKRAEELLKRALAEKEVLLKEVHHRVKNNLQTLIYLIDMQTVATKDPEVNQALAELQGRIRATALIHEKLYQTENLTQIDFEAYLADLVHHLRRALTGDRGITIRVEAASCSLEVNQAIPCGLIINELVTNAVKYAFPDELTPRDAMAGQTDRPPAEIVITFTAQNNQLVLTVHDNGIGLPAGYNWRETKSLGLKLVDIWARHQLNGSFEVEPGDVDSPLRPGANFIIRF
ncbi:MAG: PAS domain-containing protein [Anaerolineae bacterium]|nr:PAS domain-containing protein [Anaerolineae bacterium]